MHMVSQQIALCFYKQSLIHKTAIPERSTCVSSCLQAVCERPEVRNDAGVQNERKQAIERNRMHGVCVCLCALT